MVIFNVTNPRKEFKKPLKKLFDGFTDTQGLRELIVVMITLVCGLGEKKLADRLKLILNYFTSAPF